MNLDEIKSRINPQYKDCPGTESYERKWLCDEIEQLRQRVAELEKDCDEYHQVAINHMHANEKLTAERDELLAVLEELSLYVAYNGDDWVQKNAKAAIASVKEK